MLCEICHENEARVTYTEIINGVRKEQHLCESCAAKQTPFNIMGKLGPEVQFGNILSGLLQSFAKGLGSMQEKEAICGRCGMTASEFAKTGKLGCPECYRAFSAILDKNLSTLQGAVENKGKKPMNAVYFEPARQSGNTDTNGIKEKADVEEATGNLLGSAGTIDDILGKPEEKAVRPAGKSHGRGTASAANTKGTTAGSKTEAAKIASLRKKMEKAVKNEDYEEAAILRDLIYDLEGNEVKPGSVAGSGDKTTARKKSPAGKGKSSGEKASSRRNTDKNKPKDTSTPDKSVKQQKKGSSPKKAGK
ncbi:MAG: UvrB/UvrC motif-containing protein [Lachnospiraceae bacterium]|nr:UvrB/UvrC motif-containing protein [Lachnospiraceae bacterium]